MTLKKIAKRMMAVALSVALLGSMVGCDEGGGQTADPSKATAVPDYSDSNARMNMYAYVGPTPGNYTTAAGQQVFGGDNRSVETYQEYKDCGFDTLLLLGNDAYKGENFETSDLKMNLDLCEQVGLKTIVFDVRLHDLAANTESLIGEGKEFATMEDLTAHVRACMEPYMEHAAFYGVGLVDEPSHNQFDALGEVTKAVKTVDEDIFVHTVMLPYLAGVTIDRYTGASFGNASIQSYKTYINDYLEKSGADYFGYDNYPFKEEGLLDSYFRNLQVAVTEAAAHDADVVLTGQSCEMLGQYRSQTETDFRYQGNVALAFGVKNLLYYTYWMFPNRVTENYVTAIMDDDGTKMLYDEVQKVNLEIQEMAKVLLHFDYEKANFTYDKENAITAPAYFSGVKSDELDGLTISSVSQPTLITQMKDAKKELIGYMVVNISEPNEKLASTVKVQFEGYDYATMYKEGVPETVGLTKGALEIELECGEAVFVIPHK